MSLTVHYVVKKLLFVWSWCGLLDQIIFGATVGHHMQRSPQIRYKGNIYHHEVLHVSYPVFKPEMDLRYHEIEAIELERVVQWCVATVLEHSVHFGIIAQTQRHAQ